MRGAIFDVDGTYGKDVSVVFDETYTGTTSGVIEYVASTVVEKKGYTGKFPTLPLPRRCLRRGNKGTNVKHLQKFLNWYGNYKLDVDGSYGPLTEGAVRSYQKSEKLVVDGLFGKASLKRAKEVKK